MDSIFYHNPDASLAIHMREGLKEKDQIMKHVQKHQEDGKNISIVDYSLQLLLRNIKSKYEIHSSVLNIFLEKLKIHEQGKFWFNNESNLVRILVILQFGGIYLDMDIIVTKPLTLEMFRNNLAYEDLNNQQINNNVLIFDSGHPFLVACLQEFLTNYNGNMWGANGPALMTRVYNASIFADIKVLSSYIFQPIAWHNISTLYKSHRTEADAIIQMKRIIQDSYGIHLNNKISKDLKSNINSTVSQIVRSFCKYCEESN